MPQVLGIYDAPADVAEVVSRLRGRGYTDLETYAPAPFAEVDDAVIEKPSRVRLFTLIGGLTGVVTGYAMTIWMANDWRIMLGGKPFSSIPLPRKSTGMPASSKAQRTNSRTSVVSPVARTKSPGSSC